MYKTATKTQQADNPYADRFGLVYVRVSSKKQETEGHGKEGQEGRCVGDLASIKVPFEKSFPDTFTGAGDFMKRPAMRALLAHIDAHPHKKYVVVFDDLKRFARDVEFHFKLRSAFRARDVVLRCLNYNFQESDEGWFAELVSAGSAELERRQNRRQVIQKTKARLEQGYYPFNSKKGYDFIKDPVLGRIAVANKEGEVLRGALEGFATGRLRRKIDVSEYLVEQGYYSNKQPPVRYLERVGWILKDPFHCGDIEYLPWEVERRPGHHRGIISRQTYDLIQKRFYKDEARSRPRENISDKYPLRGLVLCSNCINPMTAATSKGRHGVPHVFYFCFRAGCPLKTKGIRKKDMEDKFDELLKRNRLKPSSAKIISVVFERVWAQEVKVIEQEERVMEQRRKALKEKIAGLSTVAPKASSDAVRLAYEGQIEEAAKELEGLQPRGEGYDLDIPFRTALAKATGLLEKPYEAWHNLNTLEKQFAFFFIFDAKLEYAKDGGFRTAESLCAARLFEELTTETTMSVRRVGFEPT